jgi:D-alanyl-D-alanine carboxypeptidase (penicillin-binding protein 5/6)
MTKIAALLLFFEKLEEGALSYGDLIPISSNAVNVPASKAGLKPGEHISVDTLLKCILLPSGSDAVIALGEYIYGNEAALLLAMQEKVAELSLDDTHFTNCVGMHEAGHVSSAYDMGRLAYELVSRYPKVYEYSSLQAAVLKHEDGSETVLINTNDMLGEAGVCGLKTGSGSSDYNIAMTYKKGGKHLIIIVLSSPSHEFRKLACMDILNAFR